MKSRTPLLSPCSSKSPTKPQEIGAVEGGLTNEGGGGGGGGGGGNPITARLENPWPNQEVFVSRSRGKGRGVVLSKAKRAQKGASSFSSSSSSSSTSSSARRQQQQQQQQKRGVQVRSRLRSALASPDGRSDDSFQDLALPLGMSFAAIVSQVLDGTNGSRDQIPVDRLSLICTSAVKESVSNIYGDRFDCFLRNFEKSFGSTWRTLRLINETSIAGQGNRSTHQVSIDNQGNSSVNEPSICEQGNITCSSFVSSSSCEAALGNHESLSASIEEFQENPPLTSMNNQLILHGQLNQLAHASHSFAGPGFNQSILSTFEKSVMEQTRSNDLKAFEIGLISRKLQLKESQLALNSCANMLEKIKISMGISKAFFKEEKLRTQMLDTRHAELLKRCIDLLVTGLITMSGFLVYGASIYSYHRITEATSSCSATSKESRSWWIPKPMSSFSSGWLMLKCHVVALTRMSFGFLMILAIAYSVFQRSAMSGPTTMPVTFILLMLGIVCGVAGKLCVDTLGGSGLHWLLYWEALCLLHFFANVFPSALYYILYGPISVSQGEAKAGRLLPYCLRRCIFYFILLFVLPAMSGLLPFASLDDWKEHLTEKITLWRMGVENEN